MSDAIDAMRVHVNGEVHLIAPGLHLTQFLEKLGLDARKVAVERNEEIVPRSLYGGTKLESGDMIEIVHFIGGG